MAARDPVTGRYVKGGGGGKRRSSGGGGMVLWTPPASVPAPYYAAPPKSRGGSRRRGGLTFSIEDLLEGALYSMGLDWAGDWLEARGTSLPMGLSGRDAAGVGAIWWGRKKRQKKWLIAGLIEAAPAIKGLLGGITGGSGPTPQESGQNQAAQAATPAPAPAPAVGPAKHLEQPGEEESTGEDLLEDLGLVEILETLAPILGGL